MNEVRVAVADVLAFRWRALAWATTQQAHQGGFILFLNNNGIAYPNDPFPNRLFVGAKRVISFAGQDAFQALHNAHQLKPSYLAGYFGYDLKNQLEDLSSRHSDRLGFPDAYFVEPEWVIDFGQDDVVVTGEGDGRALVDAIGEHPHPQPLSLRDRKSVV